MSKNSERRFVDFLKPYKNSYIGSVLLAIASVFWGLAPYYILYRLQLLFYSLSVTVCPPQFLIKLLFVY